MLIWSPKADAQRRALWLAYCLSCSFPAAGGEILMSSLSQQWNGILPVQFHAEPLC